MTNLSGISWMLRGYLLKITTLNSVLRNRLFLKTNCFMSRRVLVYNSHWIGSRLIFIDILNVKSLECSPNTNIWFWRTIWKTWLSTQRENSTISLSKRPQTFLNESKNLNWIRMKSIMEMPRGRNPKQKSSLSMGLVLLRSMVNRLLITSVILITELKHWNLWSSQKLQVSMILSLMWWVEVFTVNRNVAHMHLQGHWWK